MYRKILIFLFSISFLLLILSGRGWYNNYQDSMQIKKDIMFEYLYNQDRIADNLDYIIENINDREKIIHSLRETISYIQINIYITGNSTFIGQHVHLPYKLAVNLDTDVSAPVYYAFNESINSNVQQKTLSGLINYRDKLRFIVGNLEWKVVREMNLKQIYKTMDDVATKLK